MQTVGLKPKIAVGVALLFSMVAFVLGSAQFTPALVLAVIAVPISTVTYFFGTRRLSLATVYWAMAALSAVPLSRELPVHVEDVLVALGILGATVSGALYFCYLRERSGK